MTLANSPSVDGLKLPGWTLGGLPHDIPPETAVVSSRQLKAHVEAAKEEERKNLAAELHDQTLADLGGLAIELGFLARQVSGYSDDLRVAVSRIQERLKESDQELREIVQGIFPPVLTIMGLIPAVNSFLADLSRRNIQSVHPIEVTFVATGFDNDRLEEGLEISLYRVIQQGLTNVIQHAEAQSVNIELQWQGDEVTLILVDDGVGFDVRNPKESPETQHYGLINLKNRIESFAGEMAIESIPGMGTTLRATIRIEGAESGTGDPLVSVHILGSQRTPQLVS